MSSTTSLFSEIVAALGGEHRKDGYHVACPFCGKPAKRGQTHFRYHCDGEHSGYKCFVCGAGGSLWKLAQHLKLENLPTDYRVPAPMPREPLPIFAPELLQFYEAHPDRFARWFTYRSLRPETVQRFRLGIGRLPGEQWAHMEPALILPVLDYHGRIRTLRARTSNGWVTHGGKMLYAPCGVKPNATIIVVENCANCCLIAQAAPHLTPLAPTTGAASWDARWVKRIAALHPKLVIVAGDDDKAGYAMNERWMLALDIEGVPVRQEIFTEERERKLMR